MPYNKSKEKNKAKSPLARLRAIPGLETLRPSDLDTADDDEIERIIERVRPRRETVAIHGQGDLWTAVDPGYSPNYSSPTRPYVPEFGGRWRQDFPGAGDQHVNDDSDKQKNLKGRATNDDFDPAAKSRRIQDALEPNKTYVVRFYAGSEACPALARALFGDEGKTTDDSVYVEVEKMSDAKEMQGRVPGCVIEEKPKGARR